MAKKTNKLIYSIILTFLLLSIFPSPQKANAAFASLALVSSGGNYKIGSTFTITLNVDSGQQAINAVEGVVNYPADLIQFQSLSTSGTIFDFWTRGPIGGPSNTSFGGGIADPGFNGGSGRILSMNFKVIQGGYIDFIISGARVLANDGEGTNILASSSGVGLKIGNPVVTKAPPTPPPPGIPTLKSPSHPTQTTWYTDKTVNFIWTPGVANTGYTYLFDQSNGTEPNIGSISRDTKKNYENVADGIWYFHLKAAKADGVLPTVHYRIQIDTVPPKEFTITADQTLKTNPQPRIVFEAKDDLSGISRYEAKIDNGIMFVPKSGDPIPRQRPGDHTIVIKAFDNAGNVRESTLKFHIEGLKPPIVSSRTGLLGLLEPVCFEGYAGEEDTVTAFLDGKEVKKFITKDFPLKDKTLLTLLPSGDNIESFQFCHKALVMPGSHNFTFSRVNKVGAESEMTKKFGFKIDAATVKLGKNTIPMKWIIFALFWILLLLVILIIFLLGKLRKFMKNSKVKMIPLSAWYKNSSLFSKKIEVDIKKLIPDHDLTKKEVEQVKEQLIQDIEAAEKEFDEKIEKPT